MQLPLLLIPAFAILAAAAPKAASSSVASASVSAPASSVQSKAPAAETPLPAGYTWSPPMDSVSKLSGGSIVKVRYQARTILAGGTVWNAISSIAHPCGGVDCYIHTIQAGLEYMDGSNANVDTGAWLHHMVLLHRRGALVSSIGDTFCSPIWPRRFFASGNERTVVRAIDGYGIRAQGGDSFIMIVDLMNESENLIIVYPTVTYEIVTGLGMLAFKESQLLWIDVTGCGISEYPARTGYYELNTPEFTSTIAGPLLYAGGHVHDGGERFIMYHNGVAICTAEHVYGYSSEYISHHGIHISDASICNNIGGQVKIGDKFSGKAIYNDTKHPQMVHNGALHNIMGIGNVFVGTGVQG